MGEAIHWLEGGEQNEFRSESRRSAWKVKVKEVKGLGEAIYCLQVNGEVNEINVRVLINKYGLKVRVNMKIKGEVLLLTISWVLTCNMVRWMWKWCFWEGPSRKVSQNRKWTAYKILQHKKIKCKNKSVRKTAGMHWCKHCAWGGLKMKRMKWKR